MQSILVKPFSSHIGAPTTTTITSKSLSGTFTNRMSSQKRNRESLVCTFCKQRKRRCDRQKPCSVCVKYGNPNCVYDRNKKKGPPSPYTAIFQVEKSSSSHELNGENKLQTPNDSQRLSTIYSNLYDASELYDPGNVLNTPSLVEDGGDTQMDASGGFGPSPFSTNNMVTAANIKHHYLGMNPVCGKEGEIKFADYLGTYIHNKLVRRSYSALTTVAFLRCDPVLACWLEYCYQISPQIDAEVLKLSEAEAAKSFIKKIYYLNGVTDVKEYTTKEPPPVNKPTPDLQARSREFENQLLAALPVKKAIWRYVNLFFIKLYPIFPIIDQREFMDKIISIIGPMTLSEDRISSLKITKPIDFAVLGALLIILRLSNHVMTSSHSSSEPENYLLEHSITQDSVDLAKRCFSLFNVHFTGSIEVVQLFLLIRIYTAYAPEEGDSLREPESYSNTMHLLNLLYSLGYNRDSFYTHHQEPDSRQRKLNRKIWYQVYNMCVSQCIINGYNIPIRPDSFDTLVPSESPDRHADNIIDKELESVVNSYNSKPFPCILELTKLMDLIGSIKLVKVCDITELLNIIEASTIKYYGYTREVLYDQKTHDLPRLIEVGHNLSIMDMDVSLIFYLFNYYQKENDIELVGYYVEKLILGTCYEIIPVCLEIFSNCNNFFPQLGDFTLIPTLFSLLYKAQTILISLRIRFKRVSELNTNESIAPLVKESERMTAELIKQITEIFGYFSPRYFSAWRLEKEANIAYDLAINNDFFEYMRMRSQKGLEFTEEQFERFYKALQLSWDEINQYKKDGQFDFSQRKMVPTIEHDLAAKEDIDKMWQSAREGIDLDFDLFTNINVNEFLKGYDI